MAGGVEEDDIGPAEAHREALEREWRSVRGSAMTSLCLSIALLRSV